MNLIIAGDLSLQDRAARLVWNSESLANSFGGIKSVVSECDHAIVNLESPITKKTKPIIKDGPALKNTSQVFDVIDYCGFDTVTLANNHLKDFGSDGVIDTIKECKNRSLNVVGAGENLLESRKPLIITCKWGRVGILNVCEHESSIANKRAGANPLDFPNVFEDILKLRNQVERVIVIIHGGREHYQLPTPRMKREYHLIADFGADLIVNHHQHCYSGYEIYKGKPIFYGLGNFYFDNPLKRNCIWNEGMLLKLIIEKDTIDFSLIPFEQCNNEAKIVVRNYDIVQDNLNYLNSVIADDKLLEAEFDKLVMQEKELYPFLPYGNHYLRALYNRGLLPDFISKKNKALIENAISCETHRELLLRFFELYFKK